MRKKIILAAALVAVALSASATVGIMTWCGKFTYTIDCDEVPEYLHQRMLMLTIRKSPEVFVVRKVTMC